MADLPLALALLLVGWLLRRRGRRLEAACRRPQGGRAHPRVASALHVPVLRIRTREGPREFYFETMQDAEQTPMLLSMGLEATANQFADAGMRAVVRELSSGKVSLESRN